MKKLLIIFLFVLTLSLSSCSTKYDDLYGKWRFEKTVFNGDVRYKVGDKIGDYYIDNDYIVLDIDTDGEGWVKFDRGPLAEDKESMLKVLIDEDVYYFFIVDEDGILTYYGHGKVKSNKLTIYFNDSRSNYIVFKK